MARLPVVFLAFLACAGQNPPRPVILADRLPLPPGYASEQDTEADGTRDFSTASGVRGHILRRFVQAGDDKTSPAELARYFADRIAEQGGVVFDDRFNNVTGRLDGRIPGDRPVWMHVDISDEGGVIDIVLLDERAPVAREMPVEESKVPGPWTSDVPFGEKLAPSFQPYRGWAWHVVSDGPSRARLFAFARTQACAACPVVTDTTPVTIATFDANGATAPDVPSRRGAGELSLYQQSLLDRIRR